MYCNLEGWGARGRASATTELKKLLFRGRREKFLAGFFSPITLKIAGEGGEKKRREEKGEREEEKENLQENLCRRISPSIIKFQLCQRCGAGFSRSVCWAPTPQIAAWGFLSMMKVDTPLLTLKLLKKLRAHSSRAVAAEVDGSTVHGCVVLSSVW